MSPTVDAVLSVGVELAAALSEVVADGVSLPALTAVLDATLPERDKLLAGRLVVAALPEDDSPALLGADAGASLEVTLSEIDSAPLGARGWLVGRTDDVPVIVAPVLLVKMLDSFLHGKLDPILAQESLVRIVEFEGTLVDEEASDEVAVSEEFEPLVAEGVSGAIEEVLEVELVRLEGATEELPAVVQFAIGIDTTLTPESVPLFET